MWKYNIITLKVTLLLSTQINTRQYHKGPFLWFSFKNTFFRAGIRTSKAAVPSSSTYSHLSHSILTVLLILKATCVWFMKLDNRSNLHSYVRHIRDTTPSHILYALRIHFHKYSYECIRLVWPKRRMSNRIWFFVCDFYFWRIALNFATFKCKC